MTTVWLQRRRYAAAYTALAVLFVLAVVALARDAEDNLTFARHAADYARPPFYLGDANWGAVSLQPEADAAGMKPGDAVVAVNGRPVDGFAVYYQAVRQSAPGDRLVVRIRPPGDGTTARDVAIALRPYRSASDPSLGAGAYFFLALRLLVLPAVCVGLGFWVAGARIHDRSAWLLLLLLLSFTTFAGAGPEGMFGRERFLQPLFAGFAAFRSQMLAPALLLFGIAFPERLPLDRRFPWLKWIVAGYLLLVAALASIGVGLWMHDLAAARALTSRPIEWLTGREGDFGAAVSLIAILGCIASLAWKVRTAPSRDVRRRLLLLVAGAAPAAAAFVVILIASRFEYQLPDWSLLPLYILMLTFPLTVAYAIVVHRAMDVRLVVRQGLQYVLARGGIRAIQFALLVAVSVAGASWLSGRSGVGRVAIVVIVIAAASGVAGRFADRWRVWVDRRFFREAYEADAILSDLATKVRTLVETRPLLETVATRIAQSLHLERVAILLETDGQFLPAYALGYGDMPQAGISAESLTARRLRRDEPALVHFDDPNPGFSSRRAPSGRRSRRCVRSCSCPWRSTTTCSASSVSDRSDPKSPSRKPTFACSTRWRRKQGSRSRTAAWRRRWPSRWPHARSRRATSKSRGTCSSVFFRSTIRLSPGSTTPAPAVRRSESAAITTTSSRSRADSWVSRLATSRARAFPRPC